jgi:hypothetical protein
VSCESGCVLLSLCKARAGLLWYHIGDAQAVCAGCMDMCVARYADNVILDVWLCARSTIGIQGFYIYTYTKDEGVVLLHDMSSIAFRCPPQDTRLRDLG